MRWWRLSTCWPPFVDLECLSGGVAPVEQSLARWELFEGMHLLAGGALNALLHRVFHRSPPLLMREELYLSSYDVIAA